ncbi:putative secreted protein (Por secretion system target), partial [Algoriphagus ratkowskyi]
PYSFDWTNLPIGNFSITAKATDNKGASTVSSPVVISVIVKEELPTENPNEVLIPEIFLVTPVNNQEFDKGQSIELIVMFQGSDKFVKNVEYYSGDQLIGFSNVSPFSFKWQTPTSTKHNITAKAIGEDTSNFKISESVSILVKEKIEKIFEIIDPIKDAEFNAGESILIQVQIPENVNPINRVEYYRERISIGSSTSPYSDFKWKNAPWGNHNLSAKLVFADGTEILSETVPIKVLKRNQASVKLLSSSNQKEITSGENLDLNVELNEFEAKVEFVEYFLNGEKLGSSVIQPYSYEWKNIPDGEHQLVARAVDIKGSSIYSAPMILSARKDINTLQLEYVIGPNPTTDVLNVIFTNLDGFYDFEFKVISMNGIVKRSFKAKPEESTVTINVSNLINGVYILQVYGNGNNISSKKFIIKK